jgi:hypothetical protein
VGADGKAHVEVRMGKGRGRSRLLGRSIES